MYKKILLALTLLTTAGSFAQSSGSWTSITLKQATEKGDVKTQFLNAKGHFFRINLDQFKALLATAPQRSSGQQGIVVALPNTAGETEHFRVSEQSNFAPDLQGQFPDIRAYAGTGVEDPGAVLRFSLSPEGIQTMVLRAGRETEFIEPYTTGENIYIVYTSTGRDQSGATFKCLTAAGQEHDNTTSSHSTMMRSDNAVLKTFRLALSCTAEYTNYHGGTVAGALAAMNATLTRVNGVYERDLAVRLELIANTTSLIYTNPSTDPYAGANQGANGLWSDQLQSNLNNTIGSANYDMGHLFGATGGGGFSGCIGCVCNGGKGSAYTSPVDGVPESDTFDIDYVSHEMGHQLGANHTYSVDNEGEGVNIEPGSGSTIMGYAGITGNLDVQAHSDDYFAYRSIQQIQDNLDNKTCPVETTLLNESFNINAGQDYVIPKGTAFILRGQNTEGNGANITYNWEQNDTATNNTTQNNSDAYPTKPAGPNFRSVVPNASPDRYMPRLSSVLNNTLSTTWESVSTVARALNFTLTGRDNIAGGGQTSTDAMKVTVSSAAGPFAVTSQNTQGIVWLPGTTQTITWNVAGTTQNSINTATVDIIMTTDGGQTFSTVLAAATENDGSQDIVVPNALSSQCRIMVAATNNIFYALNSTAFSIAGTAGADDFTMSDFTLYPNPNNGNFTVQFTPSSQNDIIIKAYDMRGRQVYAENFKSAAMVNSTIQLQGVQPGVYLINVQDGSRKVVKRVVVQ